MGHVDVSGINYTLSDGRMLLSDVTFRVGDGAKAALVGPNGAGKTTLMRLIAGDITAESGTISRSGGLGVMRQFIGSVRDDSTVRDLLISVAPDPIRKAANALDQSELIMMEIDDEKSQLAYAQTLSDWADVGGYDWEVLWDFCCTAALSASFDDVRYRFVNTLSGGEQKRIVLEALLRGPDEVLLLDASTIARSGPHRADRRRTPSRCAGRRRPARPSAPTTATGAMPLSFASAVRFPPRSISTSGSAVRRCGPATLRWRPRGPRRSPAG